MRMPQLDFIRFYIVLSIIYGHLMQVSIFPKYSDIPVIEYIIQHFTYSFGLGCEILFILSGFLFFLSLNKHKYSVFEFTIRKWIRLITPIFFLSCVYYLLKLLGLTTLNRWTVLYQLLLIGDSGPFPLWSGYPFLWYITSMFISMVFYFSLYTTTECKKFFLITGIIIYLSYSMLAPKNFWYPADPYIGGVLYTYLLRGLAGVGMGCFLGLAYQKYRPRFRKHSFLSFILTSMLEISLMVFFVYSINLIDVKTSYLIFPLSFIFFFFIFVLYKDTRGGGVLSLILSNSIFTKIGSYTYSIYVMQHAAFIISEAYLFPNETFGIQTFPILNIILSITLSILLGIFTFHYIEKPGVAFLNNKFNDFLARQQAK